MPTISNDAVIRIRAAVAPLHHEARVSSMQVTQALRGAPLALLAEEGDWRRVRAADGYEGWLHRGYVADDARAWDGARLSLGCTVLDGGQARRLPLGALVRQGEQLLAGEAIDDAERTLRFAPRADALPATAERCFSGTSYLWGGTTPWGADCSGMTQAVLALHGRALPRDAWQQAALGEADGWVPVAGGLEDLAAGDLLFFSDRPDRRITHVGLASGPARMMHLALGRGGWAHERLDDAADGYVAALRERFTHALRLRG